MLAMLRIRRAVAAPGTILQVLQSISPDLSHTVRRRRINNLPRQGWQGWPDWPLVDKAAWQTVLNQAQG